MAKASDTMFLYGLQLSDLSESCVYRKIYDIGFAEGLILGAREVILNWGTEWIGTPTKAQLRKLENIKDAARLDRILKSLVHPNSWDELLKIA